MDEYMVVKRYEPLIKRAIKMYVHDKNYFEDAYQEAVLAIIKVLKGYDEKKGDFNAYIKCAVIYSVKAFSKKIRENISLDEELEDGGSLYDLIPDDTCLEEEYVKDEDIKKLYRALECLNKKQREIIEEYYFNGKSMVEIAKDKRCHYNSVVRLKERALKRLKDNMQNQE
ncbi:sigma-70 family RNA polymerase sigma factor [Caloramator sp. mosi_1]|uniref:sigma-70 family RNA polymerase sigma factor n=1 Tax=Caloramator sp. mosi_1 TaxID=3023090 RepID=UPI002362F3B0|nr:sigma-70 family RNA polymerase sigma factor [Caloramator sp. mosi_1]WDC84182.1 sigma-70 family RNA polymerase sigma factor [Caloramator sp. mosi_1]